MGANDALDGCACRGDWTLLVYFGAQTRPQEAADRTILAALRGVSTKGGRAANLVYQLATESKTEIGVVRGGGAAHEIVRSGPRIDISNPGHLTAFIDWGQQHFPSRYTALFLKDHGLGWGSNRPPRSTPPPRGDSENVAPMQGQNVEFHAIFFGPNGERLHTRDIARAVRRTRRRSVDLYVFDACDMSAVEVAYEIRDVASLMVASEPSVPIDGLPYAKLLDELRGSRAGTGPMTLAKHIVLSAAAGAPLTSFGLDWAAVLEKALDALAVKLFPSASVLAEMDPRSDTDAVDLRELIDDVEQRLGGDVSAECAEVRRILKCACFGKPKPRTSIFFPARGSNQITDYSSIAFGRRNYWGTLLGEINRTLVLAARQSVPQSHSDRVPLVNVRSAIAP